jgi:glycerol kinase
VGREAVQKAGISFSQVGGLGITNQRESVVVWERMTGQPVYGSICWQCRRTAGVCEELKQKGLENFIRQKTGLPVDAYFSGTKIRWILDNIPDGHHWAARGDLVCGTIDSWLIWNLTKVKTHITDYTNASRTMLFNIKTLQWDNELLDILGIPAIMLPQVLPSSMVYGETAEGIFDNCHIPIAGIAGDQQAALFGQTCYQIGMAKNTYGTGAFVLVNMGEKPVISKSGMITTIAWGLGNQTIYALEGSIFISGAVIQWLRDNLGIISTAADSELLAATVPDNGGVYFVPAFVGLGAPYWDMYPGAL